MADMRDCVGCGTVCPAPCELLVFRSQPTPTRLDIGSDSTLIESWARAVVEALPTRAQLSF